MLKRNLVVAALTLTSLMAVAGPVAAKDGDVIRQGQCTAGSTWKLKLSPENGRIEVELQVDQNRNGRLWNVRLVDNGTLVWSGSRYTQAPSGAFTVRRLVTNRAGLDRFVARAVNPRTGEVCRGTATAGF
jgi:hypothetical protein